MEWLIMLVVGLGLFILAAPLLGLLVMVFILVPLAHLAPFPTTVARTSFDCPFSKRRVSATFVTSPDAERPTDVAACSVFADGTIRCKKECLALATVGWAPSPMAARFALIAGGQAYR